jgi:hypothetical protein
MVRQVDQAGNVVPLGQAPTPPHVRGLGDAVARVTQAFGITSCVPCVQRQERLNQLWPFQAPRS